MDKEGMRYSIGRSTKPPWWMFFAGLTGLWALLVLAGLIRDYEPPVGWTTAIATTPGWILPFAFLFWFGRVMNDQHLVVQKDGLQLAVPFRRFVPFDDIEQVKRVSFPKPLGEYWLNTFLQRKLVPAWYAAPNIEIHFHRPIKLNLYPFDWFRLLQVTLDKPNEFVDSLPPGVRVEGDVVAPASIPSAGDSIQNRIILLVCLVIIVLGFGYWIVFGDPPTR